MDSGGGGQVRLQARCLQIASLGTHTHKGLKFKIHPYSPLITPVAIRGTHLSLCVGVFLHFSLFLVAINPVCFDLGPLLSPSSFAPCGPTNRSGPKQQWYRPSIWHWFFSVSPICASPYNPSVLMMVSGIIGKRFRAKNVAFKSEIWNKKNS